MIDVYRPDGICIAASKLSEVSQKVFGKWSYIEEKLKSFLPPASRGAIGEGGEGGGEG